MIKRSESAKDGENVRRNRQRGGRKHSDPYQRTGRHSLDGNERNKHFTGGRAGGMSVL